MYQHQHAPLPLDLLEAVSQPVVVLIKALLEKDPARRFQNPAELLKAMPTMTSAIGSGGAITHESFQNVPVGALSAAAGRTPAGSGPAKISVARLPVTGGDLFGREEDINFLDDACEPGCKCRYNRCLGWCRKVYAGQPLAPSNGR
jgi:hypothetical protein